MRRTGLIVVALALLLAAGLIQASNMGFKLNRTLQGPTPSGTGKTGNNYLGLPYNQQTNLTNVSQLATDIAAPSAASTVIANIANFLTATDGFQNFNPALPALQNYALVPGTGYIVRLKTGIADRSYIAVGSHNPTLGLTLRGLGDPLTKSGNNYFTPPYHTTNVNASQLSTELGGSAKVANIARFLAATDGFQNFNPAVPALQNYALQPGVTYVVRMKSTVPITPAHY